MKELLFYRCNTCGNLLVAAHSSGVNPVCCGKNMEKVIPNTVDGSHEKHIPVISSSPGAVTVTVGTAPHPMEEPHHIEWIILLTNLGVYTHHIFPGDCPETKFCLRKEEYPVRAYAWCNLHGLWMSEPDY